MCQLDELRNCLKPNQLRKALKSLPKTLDDTYARILDKIEDRNSEDAFKILQWLAYSAQPLRIEEMVEVIAIDVDGDPRFDPENRLLDPQDLLTICPSLVTMTASELRLAHFSVKEYLVSDRVQTRYNIAQFAHANIAQMCLTYLLHFKGPSLLTSDNLSEFPLARYAAEYWTQHARMAVNDTEQTDRLSLELFQPKTHAYINWIRLFDPDMPWIDQPNMAKSLESIPSPLYYASLEGLIEPARQLVESGADVNAQGGRYGNALQAASAEGHSQVVQLLLEKGADVNTQGGGYSNALQVASAEGHDQIVQLLLEKGADVNARGWYSNALQVASDRGHGQTVQLLLEKGADVNSQGGQYGNALQAASYRGHGQIVQLLLEKGADVNAQGGRFGNALQAALAYRGHGQIVQLLLEKGTDVNAQGGEYSNVQLLLEKGADVNAQGGEFGNALQVASYKGYGQIVQLLLEKGADVNARGGGFGNALQAASAEGHDQTVQMLLEKGADVNAQGGAFGNALQAASYKGHGQIVQLLFEKGAVQFP